MDISILGCGWYGKAFAKALITDGMRVKGSTTSSAKTAMLAAEGIVPYLINFLPDEEILDAGFFNCDTLIIAIPPKSRSGEGADYIYKIARVIKAVKQYGIKKVIYISSTGVYADINETVNELTDPQPVAEPSKILLEAEDLFREEKVFRTTIIRFGGLIGPGRDPGRFFAGKKEIPNGNAPVNLIHLDDCIGLGRAILTKQAFGYLFNGCSPDHPARKDFYTQAAIRSGLEAPEFIGELKDWKIVKSLHVDKILEYQFQVDKLV